MDQALPEWLPFGLDRKHHANPIFRPFCHKHFSNSQTITHGSSDIIPDIPLHDFQLPSPKNNGLAQRTLLDALFGSPRFRGSSHQRSAPIKVTQSDVIRPPPRLPPLDHISGLGYSNTVTQHRVRLFLGICDQSLWNRGEGHRGLLKVRRSSELDFRNFSLQRAVNPPPSAHGGWSRTTKSIVDHPHINDWTIGMFLCSPSMQTKPS